MNFTKIAEKFYEYLQTGVTHRVVKASHNVVCLGDIRFKNKDFRKKFE